MAAGLVTITILDGGGTSRSMNFWSSDGTTTGVLSPVQGVVGGGPKFASIAISSSGVNEVVAAVTSKKIRVLSAHFSSAGTVNAKWQGDTAGTPADLTGLAYCVANTSIILPFNPYGHFESASGKNLGINLSAGTAIGGSLVYVEV